MGPGHESKEDIDRSACTTYSRGACRAAGIARLSSFTSLGKLHLCHRGCRLQLIELY
jgi:hypothetical protein